MKPFKLTPFLLAFSLATAPFVSFISHAAVHLVTSEDEHVHEAAVPHHSHEHHSHHILTLTPLPVAIAVSGVKIQPVIKLISELTAMLHSAIQRQQDSGIPVEEAPPVPAEFFISLLLHPTNAPPLR